MSVTESDSLPVLWHLKVSNYNEKARWALDYKGMPHVRRAVLPGNHTAVAERLTGGATSTFPVLELDGKMIGDSSRIIEALEERRPDPPLYPADRLERERALGLEDFFDEELGPHVRLLVVHHLLGEGGLFLRTFAPDLSPPRRLVARATFPALRGRLRGQFGINEATIEHAFLKIREAGRRLRAELRPSGYLCEDRFTVADLTLAALVAPALAPKQFPYPQPQRGHPVLEPVRDALAEAGIADFCAEMYERHRGTSAEVPAADQDQTVAQTAPK